MMDKTVRSGTPVVTRFAPSPTGYLHLGHAYSAMVNFAQARASGGRFLLRIEDIDKERCRPEYETAIFKDLEWLGLNWDESPLRQSDRLAVYEAQLTRLHERGLVYRCFKTRRDIADAMNAPHTTPDGVFRGGPLAASVEREYLEGGRPFAWRLSLDAAEADLGPLFRSLTFIEESETGLAERPADPRRFGDVVLGRKDSGTSYHLASVLDDAAQGVTHVTRGDDLRETAGLHVLLCALFGLDAPIYRHHQIITNEAGQRLSKRDKPLALRAMREAGMGADQVRARLPQLSGAV